MPAIISHDHRFYESSKRSCNRVAIRRAAEKSSSHYQEKHNGFTISPEMDSLLRSMREDTLGRMNNGKDEVSAEAEQSRKLTPASGSAPEPVNLTVKTVRDKKKRRKKKKGVVTICNNSILHVYEPFSSDKQFYPCNNTGFLLSPGEVASVCFMFLPRWLGLSSAHLVLQTNRGGFLVQAKGFAVKSLYGAQPLVSIAIPANPWSMKTFSVFNPLNEPLFVEGVIAWISISSENSSLHTEVNCLVENHDSPEILPLGIKDQLIVKSNGLGAFQMVAVKPYGSWEIGPGKREDILEMELLPNFEGRISGTVSLQLLRSSKEQIDTIIFPLEVDLGKKIAWNDPRALVSVFLEPLVSYDDAEMTMAISLKNDAPYMLAVVNVSKVADTSLFHIKHNKGLLLFPGSVTQVALISCAQLPSAVIEASDINNSCVVLVLTNDSSNPEVEILCRDVFHICSRNKKDSSNKKSGPSGSGMSSSSQVKALERAHSDDELILGNWKSQGIRSNLSVLKEHEVTFPVVQVGTHGSRYITVKNPSHEPVVMQFVLNSGEIIDECKGQDSIHFSQFNGSVARKGSELGKNAFSVAENAVTEAYVYPSSELTFGPIHFHPSNRCRWRSSALIRNNLSGVEWISLKGLGGSLSLILLEKSEPVHTIEFQPDVPSSLGMSPMCYKPLSKVLYAKNTGDFPLEIQSISVSGTKCGGDGFVVHQCKSFSLEPGESSSFHLSYHMDLSASTVNRDLEFVSESGVILAVPLKASIPVLMLNLCKKSVFSVRLKKFSMAVLLAAASLFLLLYFVFPQMTAIISHDHRFYESSKRSCNRVAIRRAAEKSSSHYQEKHNGFTISPEMDSLLRSMREDTLGRMNNGKDEVSAEAEQSRKLTPASGSAPEPVNLTVKTVRDKKKRRKKKKGVVTMRLMEVSSSHSGNSTPTSPISPAISATPETDDHPFRRVEPPGSGPPRAAKPSVLSHSATFPCTATRSVTIGRSSSPLAPSARAPGAKLGGKESVKRKEEMWYDMWGDHLKGLNLMDKFKEVRAGKSSGLAEDADDDSDSFFVKGPQSFLTNSHPRYVSFFSP
ncbi:PREDICTED: uncharacterized protein LOC104804508 [Tarenaya hassleriana]|uniref:uncharacterized protein LOC104804508 n=1 Tax=Tarenaya hassleriana TaxID=28532 RepID=UPI00053CA3D2|nr:PREDICTED: uncharacterized protein LOC104804508 [Tarenaya hassleriana]